MEFLKTCTKCGEPKSSEDADYIEKAKTDRELTWHHVGLLCPP
jgi:hypothetical protein